jgi:methionyl-tRNA formyltransferase
VPSLLTLAALRREGVCELAGVLTNPDAPRKRSGAPVPSDIALAAQGLSADITDLPVLKYASIDADCLQAASDLRADILVSFAYGSLFPTNFLALFAYGGINVHPSLLPLHRGAAPIQSAILCGDRLTGVSVQRLAPRMDAGDILAVQKIPLTGRETAGALSETAALAGAQLLDRVLRAIADGTAVGVPQDEAAATYCRKLSKADGRIDWTRPAREIDALIRALTPWPLCFTTCGSAELLILEAAPREAPTDATAVPGTVVGTDKDAGILIQTGEGLLAVSRLQYRTRKPLDWRAFLNGARGCLCARLG